VRDATFIFVFFGGFMALFAIVAVLILAGYKKANEELRQLYERLAGQFGGRVTPGDAMIRPKLIFDHHGWRVVVDTFVSHHGKHRREYTQIVIPWPDQHLRMTAHPEQPFEAIGKLLGLQDIEIGSPYFDSQYRIAGNNELEIRRILSPAVQEMLDGLRGLPVSLDVHLSIMQGELRIKKLGRIRDYYTLSRFVSIALAIHEQALGAQSAGVEFIEPIEATLSPPSKAAICQVCGEEIAAEPVFCKSCQTPHHRDCWQYNGACSTYGCRQTRFTSELSAGRKGV
jgi:hypothetical protein